MIFEIKTDSELLELRDVLVNFYKILPYEKDLEDAKKKWLLIWKELIKSKVKFLL